MTKQKCPIRTGMVLAAAIGFASFTIVLGEERFGVSKENLRPPATAAAALTAASPRLEEARRQAEVLHTAMQLALQTVHRRYYREDEGLPIPAAVLTEVFADLGKEQQVKLRWLVVDGQAMNIDHKPQDSFENDAVQALKSGRQDFERVENGVYRRAGSITLTNHCLKCHVPDRKSTEDRTAGLTIAIPIQEK